MGKDDDDNKDDAGSVIAFAAAAAGVMALGTWGISKWLGSSEEPQPKRQEQIMMPSSSSRLTNIYNDQTSYVGNTAFPNYEGAVKDLKWKKPKAGWDKLNIDGSSRKQPHETTGPARAGGLIRDHKGFWVVGFTAELQDCDGVSAELQAIRFGLKVARHKGYNKYKNLEVETDCDEAVRLIYDRNLDLERHYCGSSVGDCRELLEELGVEIKTVHRSQNKCADGLAKVPIPQGKLRHVWYEVSDLPKTHFKNFNDLYLAERESY